MKKIILILALIFSVNASSQYYKYFYFSVPAGEESEYLQMEGEHFGKVMEKAVQDGAIQGWSVYRKVDSKRHEYNYYSFVNFGSLETLANPGIGKYFNERYDESGSPGLISKALDKFGSYMVFSATFYRHDAQIRKNSDGFRYLKHNYAKVPDVGAFIQAQGDNWGPFIKKYMDNGEINQNIWVVSNMINPTGNGFDWNVKTVDGYDSLEDFYDPGKGTFPDLNEANLDDINKTIPNGWYKSLLWERVYWIGSDGKLKSNN